MFLRQERSIKDFIQFYPIVAWIIIINLALWLLIDFFQLSIVLTFYQWGVGNNLLIHQEEYWRLLTPIFLHGGFSHVLFNSFSLVLFGPALEQMLGRAKFIILYLGAGIIGNIATYALGPTLYAHLGASGAVFGLFGAYLYMVVLRKDLIDDSNAQIVVIISIIALVMTFLRPNINIYAHVFGLLGGLIMAPIVLRNAQSFSMWRNKRRRPVNDGSIQFDPNRWKKKRLPRQLKKNLIWIILGILVLLGLIGRVL